VDRREEVETGEDREKPSKNTPDTAIRTGVLVSSEYGV
jgi:hypothetical protein